MLHISYILILHWKLLSYILTSCNWLLDCDPLHSYIECWLKKAWCVVPSLKVPPNISYKSVALPANTCGAGWDWPWRERCPRLRRPVRLWRCRGVWCSREYSDMHSKLGTALVFSIEKNASFIYIYINIYVIYL